MTNDPPCLIVFEPPVVAEEAQSRMSLASRVFDYLEDMRASAGGVMFVFPDLPE